MRNSYFLYLIGRLCIRYCSFEERIGELSGRSAVLKAISKFWSDIKVGFETSLVGRLTDSYMPSRLLNESKAVSYFKALYERQERHMAGLLEGSKTACLSKEMKKELYAAPVRTGSIILVLSVLINISLSVILKKEINLSNLIIEALVLFTALGGLSCRADWETVRKNSAVFNKIFK